MHTAGVYVIMITPSKKGHRRKAWYLTMKPITITRLVIVLLAVICIVLVAVYITSTLSCGSAPSAPPSALDEIAGYGSQEEVGYQQDYGTAQVVSGSDGIYTVTDDATIEMDSIPNDAAPPSGSDIDR